MAGKVLYTHSAGGGIAVSLAEGRGLFLLEAFTTQAQPNYKTLRELLPRVGRVRSAQCSHSQYSSRHSTAGTQKGLFWRNPQKASTSFIYSA